MNEFTERWIKQIKETEEQLGGKDRITIHDLSSDHIQLIVDSLVHVLGMIDRDTQEYTDMQNLMRHKKSILRRFSQNLAPWHQIRTCLLR